MRPARRARRPASTADAHRRRHAARIVRLGDRGVDHAPRRSRAPSRRRRPRRCRCPASSTTGTGLRAQISSIAAGLAMPRAGADQRSQRHHRGAADIGQLLAGDRVLVAIGQHGKALAHQLVGGAHQLLDIGVEGLAVADQLELDPVGLQRLARQLGGQDRVARGDAARGVGQDAVAVAEQIDEAFGIAVEADPADRDGDQLGAARLQRIEQHLLVRVAGGADEQPRVQLGAGDDQRVGRMGMGVDPVAIKFSRPAAGARSRPRRPATAPLPATRRGAPRRR